MSFNRAKFKYLLWNSSHRAHGTKPARESPSLIDAHLIFFNLSSTRHPSSFVRASCNNRTQECRGSQRWHARIQICAHTHTRVSRRARLFTRRGAPVWTHRAGFISFSLQLSFSSWAYLHRTRASAVTGSLYTSPLSFSTVFHLRHSLHSSCDFLSFSSVRVDFIRCSISWSHLSALCLLFLFHSSFFLSFAFSFFRFQIYIIPSTLIVRYYISISCYFHLS